MLIAITSAALAIVLFLCFFLAFLFGLRLGKTVSEGKDIPTPIQAVKTVTKEVKAIKQEHEQDKVDKKYNEALDRLYAYTGEVEDET